MAKSKQLMFFKRSKSDYGGDLLRTRAGRTHGRPLSKKATMHLVLRSTKARGPWSLLRPRNRALIERALAKFSKKYGIRILSLANVGNHLHLQMRITNRATYNAFIRAVSGIVAKAVMACEPNARINARINARTNANVNDGARKFWDHRPFSRIATSFREYLNLKDYVRVNQLEGDGWRRNEARQMIEVECTLAESPIRNRCRDETS